jgi:multiple antibiotic resistance protein
MGPPSSGRFYAMWFAAESVRIGAMESPTTLFISVFTTLLAIINPLEALPVFLKLLAGQDDATHLRVARRSCFYAMLLMFFFLLFGTLILRIFGVPLSMVRIVGGIVLMKIGFELFSPSASGGPISASSGDSGKPDDVAFVPLAMPIMFGPGAIATILGMTSMIKESEFELPSFLAVSAAIALTMAVTYLCLASARKLIGRIGPKGIDAVTRLVGFFVATMGMGLIFHGLIEAWRSAQNGIG